MKQRTSGMYDVIAGLFVILTVVALVIFVALLSHKVLPPVALRPVVAAAPTQFVAPTDTITPSPTDTPVPTLTLTPSLTLTITPSLTVTPIPPTPTETPAVQPTSVLDLTLTGIALSTQNGANQALTDTASTATAGAAQPAGQATAGGNATTGAPAGNYPFAQPDPVQYTGNPDPNLNCNVEAIAGQVFDLNHKPLTSQVEIFIFNASGKYKQLAHPLSTSQPPFGVGFWLQVINEHAGKNTYMVEVLDRKLEKQISTTATINFDGDCTHNVALVNFSQTQPFTFP